MRSHTSATGATRRTTPGTGPIRNGRQTVAALRGAPTRARLVEASITCIAKFGYANTSLQKIADEAGLSRGAAQHHFGDFHGLIRATISELQAERLRAFRRSTGAGKNDVRSLVRAQWRQLQSPAFIASHELALASRCQPELASIMTPLQAEFLENFHALAASAFPEWRGDREGLDLALALSRTLLETMALNLVIGAVTPSLVEPMLALLENQLHAMNPTVPIGRLP